MPVARGQSRTCPLFAKPLHGTCPFFALDQRTSRHHARRTRSEPDMFTLRQPPHGTCPFFASHPRGHAHSSPAIRMGHAHSSPPPRDIKASCPSPAVRPGHVHSSPPTPRNMPIPRRPPRDMLILGLDQGSIKASCPSPAVRAGHVPRWRGPVARRPSASTSASSSTVPKFTGSCANRPRNRPETPSSVGSSPGLADPP